MDKKQTGPGARIPDKSSQLGSFRCFYFLTFLFIFTLVGFNFYYCLKKSKENLVPETITNPPNWDPLDVSIFLFFYFYFGWFEFLSLFVKNKQNL